MTTATTIHITDLYIGTDDPDEAHLIEMLEDHIDLPDGFDFSTVSEVRWTAPMFYEDDEDGAVFVVADVFLEVRV